MAKALDLTNQKFGKLTAIEKLPNKNGKTYWLCKCDCGNYTQVQTSHLTTKKIQSCGCLHKVPEKHTILSNISDEDFINIVNNSFTYKEIVFKCGYTNASSASVQLIKNRIKELNLFFESKKQNNIQRTDKEIFIKNSPVGQTVLRKHYKDGKYSKYECSICGLKPFWNGKELSLTLDHINGNNKDDRLENLRWVCPNCDRQLDTFGTKNIVYQNQQNNIVKEEKKYYCTDCGIEISKGSIRCPNCAKKQNGLNNRLVDRPSREELKKLIRNLPFTQIGKQFNISDNSIRKWCDSYQLPRTKKEISQLTDEEWEKI